MIFGVRHVLLENGNQYPRTCGSSMSSFTHVSELCSYRWVYSTLKKYRVRRRRLTSRKVSSQKIVRVRWMLSAVAACSCPFNKKSCCCWVAPACSSGLSPRSHVKVTYGGKRESRLAGETMLAVASPSCSSTCLRSHDGALIDNNSTNIDRQRGTRSTYTLHSRLIHLFLDRYMLCTKPLTCVLRDVSH